MNSDTYWLTVLGLIQTGCILAGVVIFMITPKPGRLEYAPFGALLICSFLSDVFSHVAYFIFDIQANPVLNIADFFYFTFIVLLFKRWIHLKNVSTIAYTILTVYFTFGIANLLFIQGLHNYNSYTWSISNTCIIIITLTYFYLLLQQLPTESIAQLPMFWITTAMLIYYSGTFVIYLAMDYLVQVLNNNTITYWMIHHTIGIVYYSTLWYPLLLIRSEHRQKRVPA